MKKIYVIIFSLILVVKFAAFSDTLKFKMVDRMIEQSRDQNYTRLNGFPILYYKHYIGMSDEKKMQFSDAFVLIDGKISKVTWSYYGGARAVIDKVGCGFFNRYYENIKQYEAENKNVTAICVLPYFGKCVPIMEGIDNFYN